MNYISQISQIPSTVTLVLPFSEQITLIGTDIIDGGDSFISRYLNIIEAGFSQTVYTDIIDGGDSQVTGSSSSESPYEVYFLHTATRNVFQPICRNVRFDDNYVEMDVRFEDIPYVGQYEISVGETNGEIIYVGLLEIVPTPKAIAKYQNNLKLYQQQ